MNQPDKSRQAAIEVVRILQASGHQAYFAGGCVRDTIMGRPPQDYDVATSAHPAQVLLQFPKAQKVGAAFGVTLVRKYGVSVEVATFRADGKYDDGRHPIEVIFSSAELDAQRRDFTCNGLFSDPISGEILDFVGGQKDIQAQCVRAIGKPAERFAEDHLRMIRAIRFAAKLDFEIEKNTWRAIQEHAPAICRISRERIGQEMRMILTHPSRHRAVELLVQSGLLMAFWPIAIQPTGELNWLKRLPPNATFVPGLIAMIRDLSTPDANVDMSVEKVQHSLMLSGQETADMLFFFNKLPILQQWQQQPLSTMKRILADARSADLLALHRASTSDVNCILALETRVREISTETLAPKPMVNGEDLILMGESPGPNFRRWLDLLYNRQLENEFADREAALKAAKALISQRP